MYNILVCGHVDITPEQFEKYYIPDIQALLKVFTNDVEGTEGSKDVTFYVGGAEGTDRLAQEYLTKNEYGVMVCDKENQNNVIDPTKCYHTDGFKSYIDRDKHMVEKCKAVVVFLKNDPMSLGSGSFKNLVHGVLGEQVSDDFLTHARSQKWDTIDECLTSFNGPKDRIAELATLALVI
jgi:hypothetical protein